MTVESNFMKNCEMDAVLCQTMDRSSTWLTLVYIKESPQNTCHTTWQVGSRAVSGVILMGMICKLGAIFTTIPTPAWRDDSSPQHRGTVLASLKVPQTVLATSENPTDSCYKEVKLSQNFWSVLSQLSFINFVFLCFCCKFPSKLFAHSNIVYHCASSGLSVNYMKIPSLPRIKELLKALQSVCLTMTLLFSNNS